MPIAAVNGLEIEYWTHGDPAAPPVLLVMGLGMPAALWPDEFVESFVQRGFRVITFDNRDCGGSTRLASLPVPNVPAMIARSLLRLRVKAPYTLTDMAKDTAGVLDATGIERAHVVGASMGGMIAQVLAASMPERVLTLTSIMSSSGNRRRRVAFGKTRALRALLKTPPEDPTDIDAVVAHLQHVFTVVGSPGFPQDPRVLKALLERAARRRLYPEGTARQIGAILASGDRRRMLQRIRTPTLVIHGAQDPLVPLAAGLDTARHVPDAVLEVVEGMGHDFPPALMAVIALRIVDHCGTQKATAAVPQPPDALAVSA